MCPLRLLLIFLSASLAGFFVLRNLKSQPHPDDHDDSDEASSSVKPSDSSIPAFSKVRVAIEYGFWTFVDMASGRYLWNHLTSLSKSKRST